MPKPKNEEEAQELLNARKGGILPKRESILLKCGAPYLGESGTSKNGTLHTYYKCNGAKHHRCDAKSIRKDDLENGVCAMVLGLMRDDLVADEMANYIYGQQKNDCPESRSNEEQKGRSLKPKSITLSKP